MAKAVYKKYECTVDYRIAGGTFVGTGGSIDIYSDTIDDYRYYSYFNNSDPTEILLGNELDITNFGDIAANTPMAVLGNDMLYGVSDWPAIAAQYASGTVQLTYRTSGQMPTQHYTRGIYIGEVTLDYGSVPESGAASDGYWYEFVRMASDIKIMSGGVLTPASGVSVVAGGVQKPIERIGTVVGGVIKY